MKKSVILLLLITTLSCYAGHITKFSNTATVFKTGEAYDVYFINKTQDFFNQPLVNIKYIWTFGDSGISNEFNPIHRYQKLGVYDVKLIAVDTVKNFTSEYNKRLDLKNFKDSCNVIDTVYIQDTLHIFVYDTIKVTIYDTIHIVSSKSLELSKWAEISLFDLSGRLILQTTDYRKINQMKPGVYFLVGKKEGRITIKTKIYIKPL